MKRWIAVLLVTLAIGSHSSAAGAATGGFLRPLGPPSGFHAIWDSARHQCWVFEINAPGIWSYDPVAAQRWTWHPTGSFNDSYGFADESHRQFLDVSRDRLVSSEGDRLNVLPIRPNMTWDSYMISGSFEAFGPVALDAAGDRLLVEGVFGQLDALSLSDPPTRSAVPVVNEIPDHLGDAPMVVDPVHGWLILAGGTESNGDCGGELPSHQCWKLSLDTGTWSQLPDLPSFGGPELQLLWDAARSRVIAAGGHCETYCAMVGDMVIYDENRVFALDPAAASPAWTQLTVLPEGRTRGAIAIDPDHDELLVMGGYSPSPAWNVLEETHFDVHAMPLSGPQEGVWRRETQDAPRSMANSDFAFDPRRGTLFLHGGAWELTTFGDFASTGALWRFDAPDSLWSPFGELHSAAEAASVVDPEHDVLVCFGGYSLSPAPPSLPVLLSTTTVMSLESGAVTQPVTGIAPPARRAAVLVWDATRHRILMIGGVDALGAALHDVWALNPATWTWSAVATTGVGPGDRVFSAVFDEASNRVLAITSQSPGQRLYALYPGAGMETWTLLGESGYNMLLYRIAVDTARHRLLGLDTSLGVVSAPIAPGPVAWSLVQTSHGATFLGDAFYDAAADRLMIGYAQADYGPPKAHVLALEFGSGALEVPPTAGRPALALRIVGSQPSAFAPEVEFVTVPGESRAKLELFDVTGRRVWSRDLGSLVAGAHRVRVAEGMPLPAGVYAVRFVSGTEVRSARAVVLR